MLDKILNLVKEHAGDIVNNNPDIPEDKKEGVLQEAASSIMEGIQGETSGGGLQNLLSSFSQGGGGGAISGIIDKVKGTFVGNLVSKLGLDNQKASGIASAIIPLILNKLFHKTTDPGDDSFNVQELLSSVTGGSDGGEGGIMGAVKGLFK